MYPWNNLVAFTDAETGPYLQIAAFNLFTAGIRCSRRPNPNVAALQLPPASTHI